MEAAVIEHLAMVIFCAPSRWAACAQRGFLFPSAFSSLQKHFPRKEMQLGGYKLGSEKKLHKFKSQLPGYYKNVGTFLSLCFLIHKKYIYSLS